MTCWCGSCTAAPAISGAAVQLPPHPSGHWQRRSQYLRPRFNSATVTSWPFQTPPRSPTKLAVTPSIPVQPIVSAVSGRQNGRQVYCEATWRNGGLVALLKRAKEMQMALSGRPGGCGVTACRRRPARFGVDPGHRRPRDLRARSAHEQEPSGRRQTSGATSTPGKPRPLWYARDAEGKIIYLHRKEVFRVKPWFRHRLAAVLLRELAGAVTKGGSSCGNVAPGPVPGSPRPADEAKTAAYHPGDKVVAVKTTELKIDNRVVDKVDRGDPLTSPRGQGQPALGPRRPCRLARRRRRPSASTAASPISPMSSQGPERCCSLCCPSPRWRLQATTRRRLPTATRRCGFDPKCSTAYRCRGFVREVEGDHDKAIADYTETLRLDRTDVQGLHYLRRARGRPREVTIRQLPTIPRLFG